MNKVVARFADGRMIKGTTLDFSPQRNVFHVTESTPAVGTPMAIKATDLKALFFVKDLTGDPQHVEKKEFESAPPPGGRMIEAAFKDGEVLVGTTTSYGAALPGFFLVPADTGSNIERCYVVAAATQDVRLI